MAVVWLENSFKIAGNVVEAGLKFKKQEEGLNETLILEFLAVC